MYKRFGSDLQGKVALITGASKGLGLGLAKIFAQEGAKVAVASRDITQLESLAQEIRALGGICEPFSLDIRDVPPSMPVWKKWNRKWEASISW